MKTRFYEDNGGGIHAIVTDDHDNVTNVLTGFHMDAAAWDLSDLIASAKQGFPYADEYNPDEFSGLSMDEAAREIADMDDLIAEISADAEAIYPTNMGCAGKTLFNVVMDWDDIVDIDDSDDKHCGAKANRYKITYERNGKTVEIIRHAENAPAAVEALCDQYGWREKLDLYDADTRGLEWSRHKVATDYSINWDLIIMAVKEEQD